ncbi:unnamed protein product [Linum tenue]|uniref:TFIIE beta domain-containing protein n=1 Tax=Linum tenue TaxID=586396 RepID=A0AAV0N7L9_9ROSI|nr:unnamed protein product [Linum tenue]
MALQDKLDKFKKQQENMHSMLSSITQKPGPSKPLSTSKSVPYSATQLAGAKAPAQPVKFSNDMERLQIINGIRKGPVGSQIKRVIELLKDTREAFTSDQINEATYVDVKSNKAVFESLKNNLKVNYDGRHFSYKVTQHYACACLDRLLQFGTTALKFLSLILCYAKHDLKDKNQLLHLIRKFPEGIAVIDLKDAYPTVMEDLQALKAEGKIWLLSNFDSQEDIAYPNDPRVVIKVDDDLKQLFRGIELPRDMLDIEKDLQKNGMKPATNTAKRRATAEFQGISSKPKIKKKKHEISMRTKLTNAHLPHLFQEKPELENPHAGRS